MCVLGANPGSAAQAIPVCASFPAGGASAPVSFRETLTRTVCGVYDATTRSVVCGDTPLKVTEPSCGSMITCPPIAELK